MVHLIALKSKSAELVVSLARKRKRDHFKAAEKSIACAEGETRKQLVKFNINRLFCSYEVCFL